MWRKLVWLVHFQFPAFSLFVVVLLVAFLFVAVVLSLNVV
jgi:hypothetical protein